MPFCFMLRVSKPGQGSQNFTLSCSCVIPAVDHTRPHSSGVPRDASPYFSSLGWDVAAELGYVGIAAPYLDTPGMQANLALASQLDVDEEDLDSYFRFFVLRRASP